MHIAVIALARVHARTHMFTKHTHKIHMNTHARTLTLAIHTDTSHLAHTDARYITMSREKDMHMCTCTLTGIDKSTFTLTHTGGDNAHASNQKPTF